MGFATAVLKEILTTLRTIVGIVCVLVLAYVAWQIWIAAEGDRSLRLEPAPPPLSASMSLEVVTTRISALSLPEATVAVANHSGSYVDVYVRCDFMDRSGGLVGGGLSTIRGIPPGQSARGTVTSPAQYQSFDSVQCRVDGAYRSR